MNKTLKNIILAVGGVMALAIAFAAVSYVNYYGKSIQPSSYRSFSVTAEGKSTSIPDVAEFSFQVITEGGTDLSSLQTQNTDASNKVIDFVKAQGVAAKDIKTLYYNVDPRYQNYDCYMQPLSAIAPSVNAGTVASPPAAGQGGTVSSGSAGSAPSSSSGSVRTCPPASIVGYTVTQSVDVKMRDFKKVSDIMGGVVTNGANQVGSLSFTTDDPTAVQDQARADAIAKAKVKAESMAKAGGFKLGRLLNISENGYNPYPVYNESLGLSAKAAPAAPTPTIEPGSQETTIDVTMQYEIR
jgi:hypothetical protein